eukprot:m.200835 g.200835  ORF g.200835 m.200835 type:complete len:695 (+) comp32776_c0_seq2:494-2578(+)
MATKLMTGITRFEELEGITQADITRMTWKTKQRIYSVLLEHMSDDSKLLTIVDQHKANLKKQRADGATPSPNDLGFRTAFAKLAAKEIASIGKAPLQSYTQILSDTKRSENQALITWLLDEINTRTRMEARTKSPFGSRPRSPLRNETVKHTHTTPHAQAKPHSATRTPTQSQSANKNKMQYMKKLDVHPSVEVHRTAFSFDTDEADSDTSSHRDTSSDTKRNTDVDVEEVVSQPTTPTTPTSTSRKPNPRNREFRRMQAECQHVRELYDQLLLEDSAESFDRRRVNLLKAQNMQLERQVVLQADVIESRLDALQHVENLVGDIKDIFSSYRPSSKLSKAKLKEPAQSGTGEISDQKTLKALGRLAGEAQNLLDKAMSSANPDSYNLPFYFHSSFTTTDPQLVDICRGTGVAVNPAKLQTLETTLVQLHRHLAAVEANLGAASFGVASQHTPQPSVGGYRGQIDTADAMSTAIHQRLDDAISTCATDLRNVAHQILSLLVLLPTTTSPTIGDTVEVDISHFFVTIEEVLAKFPVAIRKKPEVRAVVTELLRGMKKALRLSDATNSSMQKELDIHWQLHSAHMEYANALKGALDKIEATWQHESLQHHAPLIELMAAYDEMKDTVAEPELRKFLGVFKKHSATLRQLATSLETTKFENRRISELSDGRITTISGQLGRSFAAKLNSLQRELEQVK